MAACGVTTNSLRASPEYPRKPSGSNTPRSGSTQAVGSAVDLMVSTGPGPRVEVPNVVGLTQSVAEARLRGLRLEVDAVRHHDDDVESEQVVRQAPGPPTLVELGTVVVVNVAVPVPQVTVPPLQGLALDRAAQALEDAGLTSGEVTHAPHNSAPEGVVIRQSPQSGTTVPPGDPVRLTVSSGPTLIGVPDVRSMQADEAVERLRGAGLTPAVKGLVGDFRLQDHFVSRQDPGPDARVPPGEEVVLTLDVLRFLTTLGGIVKPSQRRQGDISANITATTIHGQVVVGENNTVSRVSVGSHPEAITPEEMAQLLEHFARLRAIVATEAPADQKDAALQRVDELEEAMTADEPRAVNDGVRQEVVRAAPAEPGRRGRHRHRHSIVGKLVGAAGDGLANEFRRRFGVEDS